MPGRTRTERRRQNLLVVGLTVSSVILLLMAGLAFINTRRISDASFWVSHTWEVKAVLHELSAATERAATAERNFILTKESSHLESQTSARGLVDNALERIATLTRDNASQQQNVQLLASSVHDRRVIEDELTTLARQGADAQATQRSIARIETVAQRLHSVIANMDQQEDRLLALRRQQESRHSSRSIFVFIALLVLNFVTLGSVAWLLRRVQSLERLVTICAWSRLLKHGDEWVSIEEFLEREYGVSVSHGMSEAALAKLEGKMEELEARK